MELKKKPIVFLMMFFYCDFHISHSISLRIIHLKHAKSLNSQQLLNTNYFLNPKIIILAQWCNDIWSKYRYMCFQSGYELIEK